MCSSALVLRHKRQTACHAAGRLFIARTCAALVRIQRTWSEWTVGAGPCACPGLRCRAGGHTLRYTAPQRGAARSAGWGPPLPISTRSLDPALGQEGPYPAQHFGDVDPAGIGDARTVV